MASAEFLFVLLMACVISGLSLTQAAYSILKNQHPDIWERLGKPHIILNNTPSRNIQWMKFLFCRQYLDADNRTLHNICRTLTVLSGLVLLQLGFMFWVVLGPLRE